MYYGQNFYELGGIEDIEMFGIKSTFKKAFNTSQPPGQFFFRFFLRGTFPRYILYFLMSRPIFPTWIVFRGLAANTPTLKTSISD